MEGGKHPNFVAEVVAEFILVLIFLIVTTLLKFTRDSITLQEVELRIKEIEKQKIEAELQALKAQVNPHFFFNTLNSLYSLSLDKSDKAPELILKLSELMRFVIYDSRDDFVTMEKQLEFMKSYVYLERLRMDEHLRLTFTVTGSNLQIRIAPLIFIAFIENAFKHVSKTIPDPYIIISFDLEKTDSVHFIVENSRDPVVSNPVNRGLGLSNVRQRLNLLYPDMHDLKLEEKPDTYRVELTINH
jgi:LytS/YehU family sensor histidine kinase